MNNIAGTDGWKWVPSVGGRTTIHLQDRTRGVRTQAEVNAGKSGKLCVLTVSDSCAVCWSGLAGPRFRQWGRSAQAVECKMAGWTRWQHPVVWWLECGSPLKNTNCCPQNISNSLHKYCWPKESHRSQISSPTRERGWARDPSPLNNKTHFLLFFKI